MNKVIKRSGEEVEFDREKIANAVIAANDECGTLINYQSIDDLVNDVVAKINTFSRAISVEEIQELVEDQLMHVNHEVAKHYIRYRYEHKLMRESTLDKRIMSLVEYNNEEVKQENSNKDPQILPTQRDYIAGEVSKDITNRKLLPKHIVDAHNEGIIHFHDSDYFLQKMHNCCLVNAEDILQNGTVISGVEIEKPHTFSTACNIITQVIAQIASHQYGGQSISLAHLVPFVDETRKKYWKEYQYLEKTLRPTVLQELIEKMVKEDIKKGVQTLQYQVITLMSTNGQSPFITLYMNINEVPNWMKPDMALVMEEVLKQRIQGVKNEKGVWVTPAFPKLIYALDECNIYKNSQYYYLTELAAKCTAKRMVPDYISNKIENKLKGAEYTCMGCRSFLTPDRTTKNYSNCNNWEPGKKYYGRFNQGVVTINLVDVALSAQKIVEDNSADKPNRYFDKERMKEAYFWKILDERLDNLCYPALMARHERLKGTPSDVAPILWQHGALARLKPGETIDELLYHGYATISLGYAGLYECVKVMTGVSHTNDAGKEFALSIMKNLNAHCQKWKEATDIDFSLYGTPIESTTYKFAKCLQKRFGIIPGVTDRNYITNSYHVPVFEEINAFDKLKFESEFQELSPGGAISYVEVPNLQNNIDAVLTVMRFMYTPR